ncbi:DUF4407 domain-containing protein [Roseateles sp. DXS20W]|uniref:DUF4407 domain-containing protein n=1 Tax=Pelomonas lactea TaxID=3299030 RepID=A0ABW7GQE3_9BURK
MNMLSSQGPLHDPTARQRRLVLILAIQLPVLVWLVSSYVLATGVFGLSQLAALGVAAGLGYVVLLVELVLVLSPRHWATLTARLLLTVLMSALGALAVDVVIFRADIDARLREQKVTALQQEQAVELRGRQEPVEQATTAWQAALRAMDDEATGRGGGPRGCGEVCRHLKEQVSMRRDELDEARTALATAQAKAEQAVQALRASPDAAADAGLLHRWTALHGFVLEHPGTALVWAALFLAVMLIEAALVLAKLAGGRTLQEQLDQMRNEVRLEQARRQRAVLCEPHDLTRPQASERRGRALN